MLPKIVILNSFFFCYFNFFKIHSFVVSLLIDSTPAPQEETAFIDNNILGASFLLTNAFFFKFFKFFKDFPKARRCLVQVDPSFPGLGLHIGDARSLQLANKNEPLKNGNNMIRKLEPNSPAERAGLRPGDRILEINDENVENIEYYSLVNKLKNSLASSNVISLLVMNSVEYNVNKKIVNGKHNHFKFAFSLFKLILLEQPKETTEKSIFEEEEEMSFKKPEPIKSESRNTSRPTTPNSTKLSLYNYQPIKTLTTQQIDPFQVQPQIIKMDTFAITSSDENNSEDDDDDDQSTSSMIMSTFKGQWK